MNVAAETLQIVLEPSGTVPFAALLRRSKALQVCNILLIASGVNIDPAKSVVYLSDTT